MTNHRILPFYLTYPMPLTYEEESTVTSDLDYLMQIYPSEAKKYQKRIASILDKLDYEGSVIYEDYPDQITLYRMADSISEIIFREEEIQGNQISDEKKKWVKELVVILLFNEIYKRRHNDRKGMIRF